MVTPGRLELPTCGLGNRRSIHLSYGATFLSSYHTVSLPQWVKLNRMADAFAFSPVRASAADRQSWFT